MSSFESTGFKVGAPINSDVVKHIDNLQNVFKSKEGSRRSAYIELQGAIPWIKMTSGVKLDSEKAAEEYGGYAGDSLAKKNVLFGLNTRTEWKDKEGDVHINYSPSSGVLPGYENTRQHGVRPKPGITGMHIHSHNRFGSLRTAVVSFQCWSTNQLDIMEVLYMRPGMTVLLEWGHSKILKNNTQVVPSDFGIDYFNADLGDSMPKIMKEIHHHRGNNNYSYDAIVGIIKNFTWSLRPDGGYDCQVHLVTPGDLLESYKANFYLTQEARNELIVAQIETEKADQNFTGSLNGILEWPSTYYDNKTPNELATYPTIESLYDQFCSYAETALDNAPDYFEQYLFTLDDAEKKRIYQEAGFLSNYTDDLDDCLIKAKNILGSLTLVKGGMDLTIPSGEEHVWKMYYADGTVYDYYNVSHKSLPIKARSPFTKGIVDLNCPGNDFDTGKVTEGYAAVLPIRRSAQYNTMVKLYEYVYDFTTAKGITDTLEVALNLLKYARFNDGVTYTQIFQFTGPSQLLAQPPAKYRLLWHTAGRTGDPTKSTVNSSTDRDQYTGLEGIFGATDRHDGTNFYSLEEEVSHTRDPEPASSNTVPPFYYDTNYFVGRAVDPTSGKILPRLNAGPPNPTTFQATEVGPAAFGRVKFIGFEIMLGARTSNISEVATLDPLTGLPSDDSYLDPNDDMLSKLHYYLRGIIENRYVSRYLNQPLDGKNYTAVFEYRPLYGNGTTVPSEIEAMFNLQGERKENLERYGYLEDQLKTWNLILGGRFKLRDNQPNFNTVYIKLGALLELINRHLLQGNSNFFYLFKTTYSAAEESSTPEYRTLDDHISADPEICILPHTIADDKLKIKGWETADYLRYPTSPIILNIELGINFLVNTLAKYIDSEGNVTLLQFVQEVLDQVSRVTGGVNDLQLQYVEESSLFYVVDRTSIERIPAPDFNVINIYGIDSIVRNVNMVSKITPKMSSMIAISAQDNAFTSTQESTGFAALNRGITDRLFTDRYDEDSKARESAVDYDALRANLLSDVEDLKVHLKLYYNTRVVPAIGKDTQQGVYQNYCNFLLGGDSKYRRDNKRPTYNFIIPFELELELYGISGIRVMDAFTINRNILPKTYGGRLNSPIAFLVTGVEHIINRGVWSTKLRTQIYNIEEVLSPIDLPAFGLVTGMEPNESLVETTSPAEFLNNMPDFVEGATPQWLPVKSAMSYVSSSPQPYRALRNRAHYGVDITGAEGVTECVAVCDGIWENGGNDPSGYGDSWGYLKEYDANGQHIRSHVYGHTDSVKFSTGASVSKGDVVAIMGNKGASTGAHLHYEIWAPFKPKRQDPIVYLNSQTPPSGVRTF